MISLSLHFLIFTHFSDSISIVASPGKPSVIYLLTPNFPLICPDSTTDFIGSVYQRQFYVYLYDYLINVNLTQ